VHLPVSVELSKAVPDPEIGAQDGVLQCLHGRIGHVFADDLKRACTALRQLASTGSQAAAKAGA
jgi:hypothetical protein